MFEIALSEEEELIQESARRFALQELLPSIRANEEARGVPEAVRKSFVEAGLDAIEIGPESAGVSATVRTLILEELAAVDPGAAIALDGIGTARYFLSEMGIDAEGSRGVVLFDTEERFRCEGERLSGKHPWVPASAPDAVVVVQSDRAWMVVEGIRAEPIQACGLDAAGAASLTLDAAPLRAALEERAALARAVARVQLSTAALLVGCARGACEYARDYALQREAFGRPIAHHQGLAFLIVEMAMAVETARLAVWRAGAALDADRDVAWWGNCALAEAAEQGLMVGPAAVQVLGGHGFVRDYPVEKAMRDIRTLAQLAGGRDRAELALGELGRTRASRLFR